MINFELTDGEKSHPLWKRLSAYLELRLVFLRQQNDDADMTEQQTAALRGQIKSIRGIIALGDDRPLTGE